MIVNRNHAIYAIRKRINKNIKSKLLLLSVFPLLIFSGCSKKYTNPYEYLLEIHDSNDSDKNSDATTVDDAASNVDESTNVKVLSIEKDNSLLSEDLVALSNIIRDYLDDSDVLGTVVIVKQGAIDELSYFLHLTENSDKPIVMVGNYSDENIDDKVLNLINNIQSGTYNNSTGITTTPDATVVKGNGNSAYDLSNVKGLPNVDVIYDYTGNDSVQFNNALKNAEGIIIVSTIGNGLLSTELSNALSGKNYIPVAIVDKEYHESTFSDEQIFYTTTNVAKARIIMMLAINANEDVSTLQSHFERS